MGQGTAHLFPPGSNHRILETSPNPVSLQTSQGFWLLTGPCLESWQASLGARDFLFRPKDLCFGDAVRYPSLFTAQMRARVSVVPLYTSLRTRPL